jgi:RNA polymerase sigma-70 factor (ECF subfamily)
VAGKTLALGMAVSSVLAGYYSPVYFPNSDQVTDTGDNLAALMRQSLNGDTQAYAVLLKETARLLRPFLSKRLYASSEVDDVLQEILLSIHKARHTYDGERPYKPWMYAIAKFRLQDHLRAHYADHLHDAEDLSELEEMLPDDVTGTGFSYESISMEVEKLPEKQATILRLMHQEGYTAKEVAEKIGMNESAVKVAAHRAYKILRERLER